MSTSSLEEKYADLRHRRKVRLWVIAAVLVLVLALGALAWFTPVLRLSSVEVEGAELTDPEAVSERVLEEYTDVPLPRIRLHALDSSLEKEFPKTSEVHTRYGGLHTLTVTVTDRVPVLAVESDGEWSSYDDTGFEVVRSAEKPRDLPVLETSEEVTPELVDAAVTFLDEVPESDREGMETLRADGPDDIEAEWVVDDHTTTVVFGDAGDIEHKLEVARVLLRTRAETIDVSTPDNPVTTGETVPLEPTATPTPTSTTNAAS